MEVAPRIDHDRGEAILNQNRIALANVNEGNAGTEGGNNRNHRAKIEAKRSKIEQVFHLEVTDVFKDQGEKEGKVIAKAKGTRPRSNRNHDIELHKEGKDPGEKAFKEGQKMGERRTDKTEGPKERKEVRGGKASH